MGRNGRGIIALIAVGFGGSITVSEPALAQDASWGCQVLLCAASESPSWHGVPYCVPPMTKLIAAMKLPSFSWPICRQGNAGKPGKEVYEPCPAGWTATLKHSAGGNRPRPSVADQRISASGRSGLAMIATLKPRRKLVRTRSSRRESIRTSGTIIPRANWSRPNHAS